MPSIFRESSGSFSFLRTVPAKKPRTECFCHPVALTSTSRVAPPGRRSRATIRSCLECGLRRPGDALVAFADGAAAFFELDRLARAGRSVDLVFAGVLAAATSLGPDAPLL